MRRLHRQTARHRFPKVIYCQKHHPQSQSCFLLCLCRFQWFEDKGKERKLACCTKRIVIYGPFLQPIIHLAIDGGRPKRVYEGSFQRGACNQKLSMLLLKSMKAGWWIYPMWNTVRSGYQSTVVCTIGVLHDWVIVDNTFSFHFNSFLMNKFLVHGWHRTNNGITSIQTCSWTMSRYD